MHQKDKLMYFDDEETAKEYMRTGRVVPKEWLDNESLKKFNPWMYDPEQATKLTGGNNDQRE